LYADSDIFSSTMPAKLHAVQRDVYDLLKDTKTLPTEWPQPTKTSKPAVLHYKDCNAKTTFVRCVLQRETYMHWFSNGACRIDQP